MKTIYRVLTAVDYKGQRERELFYTENRKDADKPIFRKIHHHPSQTVDDSCLGWIFSGCCPLVAAAVKPLEL